MPSGRTHTAITVTASAALALGMWRAGFTFEQIRMTIQGCLTGIVLSPDLDVDAGFIGYFYIEKYFGKVLGTIWKIFWWPYAQLMPHRSWWSHFPLVSTVLRLAYWYVPYICICLIFGFNIWIPEPVFVQYAFWGLALSDALHWAADNISTYLKKRRRYARLHFPMSEMRRNSRSRTRLQRSTSKKTQRLSRKTR